MNTHRKFGFFLRPVLAVVIALTLALPVFSQAPAAQPAGSKVERKNKAPVSNELLRVSLPKPVKATLNNGARVVVLEDHRFPTVTVRLMIEGAGGLFEPRDLPGLASMAAQMMRQGTATMTSKQLAEETDKLGARVSVNAGFGSTDANLTASGLSENFDRWFAIATDVLLHANFPADELNQLRQRQTVMLRQQRANPGFLANERLSQVLFGEHPAAVVTTTAEALQKFTPELLKKWHDERYVPQNAIIGIAGDVKAAAVIAKLNQVLAGWKKTDLNVTLPSNPTPAAATKLFLVDRPNSVQTNLLLGNIALDRRSPDYIAMRVMNRVVGEGAAARLFMNLREEHGYTYGAYSRLQAEKFPGPWVANSEVRTDVTDGALTEFFNEIHRICEQVVPAEELGKAKRSVVAAFALSLERPDSLLGYALESEVYGYPADYWDTYATKVMGVSADDVQRVAQKYLKPGAIQVVAVGDGTKIKTVLQKYGPVEVYNTDGKPVTGEVKPVSN